LKKVFWKIFAKKTQKYGFFGSPCKKITKGFLFLCHFITCWDASVPLKVVKNIFLLIFL